MLGGQYFEEGNLAKIKYCSGICLEELSKSNENRNRVANDRSEIRNKNQDNRFNRKKIFPYTQACYIKVVCCY